MNTKDVTFRHKGRVVQFSYVEFQVLLDAINVAGEDEVLKVYNWGTRELAKLNSIGKDPFKHKRKSIRVKLHECTPRQIKGLIELGLVHPEA